jgi:hypothetical protein
MAPGQNRTSVGVRAILMKRNNLFQIARDLDTAES